MLPATKCKICWGQGPPHAWDRSAAPVIPKTKAALLDALASELPDQAHEHRQLLKPELKALFKRHIRGVRHVADPLRGASGLTQSELVEKLTAHDISFNDADKKGDMILKLRAHWNHQCDLAKDSRPNGLTSTTSGASPEFHDGADHWELCAS
eukprot:s2591_g11.t1